MKDSDEARREELHKRGWVQQPPRDLFDTCRWWRTPGGRLLTEEEAFRALQPDKEGKDEGRGPLAR
jgi:hypothetical protein